MHLKAKHSLFSLFLSMQPNTYVGHPMYDTANGCITENIPDSYTETYILNTFSDTFN